MPRSVQLLETLSHHQDIAESIKCLYIRCPDDRAPELSELSDQINLGGPVPWKDRMATLQRKSLHSALRRLTNLEHIYLTDDMSSIHDELSSEYQEMRRQAPTTNRGLIQDVSDTTTSLNFFIAALAASGRTPMTLTAAG